MKKNSSRTMSILLATILLGVSCSCGKQTTSEEMTQLTETPTETYSDTTIETEAEIAEETVQTEQTEATEEKIPHYVSLSDLDIEEAVTEMMPIMTGYALCMYEEEIKYSAKYLEDDDFIFGAANSILGQLFPGDDSYEISYEEMDKVVQAAFSEYSGDIVALMTRDNVTYDEQTKIFQMEGSDVGEIHVEVVGYTTNESYELQVLMYLVDSDSGDILRTVNFVMESNTLAETEEQNTYPLRIISVSNQEPISSDPEDIEVLSLMLPVLEGITYSMLGDSDVEEYIKADDDYLLGVFTSVAYYYPDSLIPYICRTGYDLRIIPLRIMEEMENACYMEFGEYVLTIPEDYIMSYSEENETFHVGGADMGTSVPKMESYVMNDDGTMDVVMIIVELPDIYTGGKFLFHLVPNEYSKTISDPIFPYCVAEITELES